MRLIVLQQSKRVAPIFFNRTEARDQLMNHGRVYTIRKKRKSVGVTMARQGNLFHFTELAKVNVEFVKKVENHQELSPYVGESGFKTIDEWANAAQPGADHLYKVSKL